MAHTCGMLALIFTARIFTFLHAKHRFSSLMRVSWNVP